MSDLSDLNRAIAAIVPVTESVGAETQGLLDRKTKPRRSLGRLETLACRYAAARGDAQPVMPRKAIVVMAADHGVAAEGVSAYPQEVTAQMVLNFTSGGAAINVLCRQVNAELVVVDMGVATKVDAKLLVRDARIAAGTANMTQGPAMTIEQTLAAIEQGILMAHRLADRGVTVIGLGEMGIGNTTAASALVSVLTGKSPREVTGRGTGIDDAGLAHKIDVIDRAIAKNKPSPGAPLEALAAVGGFEIAGLVGVVLGAAGRKIPIMIDGFITVAAALVAARLAPAVHGYLIASHRSVEPGHVHATAALGVEPLFDLQMRLGEGTGAALAMQMLDASIAILREMATFEDAHVADSGA